VFDPPLAYHILKGEKMMKKMTDAQYNKALKLSELFEAEINLLDEPRTDIHLKAFIDILDKFSERLSLVLEEVMAND
jgi:hypothetical protein